MFHKTTSITQKHINQNSQIVKIKENIETSYWHYWWFKANFQCTGTESV